MILTHFTISYCYCRALNNNGYPFALVNISNSRLDHNQLTLNYEINKGPLVYIDLSLTEMIKTIKTVKKNNKY